MSPEKTMNIKKKRVLLLMDYISRTGFGTVSKNIVPELKKHFGDSMHMDIIAINYFGAAFWEDANTYVIPAKASDGNDDDYGRFTFLKVLNDADYDGVFICQDLGIILPFIEVMEHIKKEKKEKNKKVFKSIYYFPVDCHLISALTDKLEFFDIIVTYTEFARKEVLKHRPELKGKIKVILHGNNSKDFFPLSQEERLKFRKEFFGENADKFIVTAVNRNQPRKDIPNTIFGFIEARKQWSPDLPKPFLYLNLHSHDAHGWDIRAIMLQTDLVEDVDYKLMPKEFEEQGVETSFLNNIYNASDVYISTTLGEGFGLCQHPLTKITMRNGVKDIKDVQSGDYVLTNSGDYKEVLDTTCRKVSDYIHLKARYGYFAKTTHEHPYYVLSNGKEQWMKADKINEGDYVGVIKPKGDKKLPETIDLADYLPKEEGWIVEENFIYHKFGYSPHNKEWSYASIVKKYKTTKKVVENARAFLSGKNKTISKSTKIIADKLINDGYLKTEQLKIRRYVSITDDLLELFGWYLADGSNNVGVQVVFDVNTTTKRKSADKIKSILHNSFGVKDVAFRFRDKRLEVTTSSKLLANLFKTLCGNGAYNKRVPPIFIGCEKSLMPLVKGYIGGDGSINVDINLISFSTVSPSLAYQIPSILACNNIFVSITNEGRRSKVFNSNYDVYACKLAWSHLRRFLDLINDYRVLGRDGKRNHKPDFIETDTHFFTPIKSIETIKEEIEVYDLCVEDSHSFVGNGLVCHNTFAESAATRLPIIAPYTTSFMEMSEYGKNAYMLETIYPCCNVGDNIIREQTDIFEIADTLLQVAKDKASNSPELANKIERSYQWVKKLEWKEVCKTWIEYFKIF